jgi:hypothetical protein
MASMDLHHPESCVQTSFDGELRLAWVVLTFFE